MSSGPLSARHWDVGRPTFVLDWTRKLPLLSSAASGPSTFGDAESVDERVRALSHHFNRFWVREKDAALDSPLGG